MTVKLSRDPGTPIKYPSLHSFVERSREPGTMTTVTHSSLRQRLISTKYHANKTLQIRPLESHFYIVKLGLIGVYIISSPEPLGTI